MSYVPYLDEAPDWRVVGDQTGSGTSDANISLINTQQAIVERAKSNIRRGVSNRKVGARSRSRSKKPIKRRRRKTTSTKPVKRRSAAKSARKKRPVVRKRRKTKNTRKKSKNTKKKKAPTRRSRKVKK